MKKMLLAAVMSAVMTPMLTQAGAINDAMFTIEGQITGALFRKTCGMAIAGGGNQVTLDPVDIDTLPGTGHYSERKAFTLQFTDCPVANSGAWLTFMGEAERHHEYLFRNLNTGDGAASGFAVFIQDAGGQGSPLIPNVLYERKYTVNHEGSFEVRLLAGIARTRKDATAGSVKVMPTVQISYQ